MLRTIESFYVTRNTVIQFQIQIFMEKWAGKPEQSRLSRNKANSTIYKRMEIVETRLEAIEKTVDKLLNIATELLDKSAAAKPPIRYDNTKKHPKNS